MRRYLTAVTALLALTTAAAAQQEPFREKIDVTAVLLDVIVTDAEGNQILGLGKDDFIVKEGGVEQEIDSVDYFTSRMLLDAREENAPFDVERVREERYFIFFIDRPTDLSAFAGRLMLVRNAIGKFIDNEMREHDRIAIVGHDTRLKIYSDFTNDKDQLKRALADAARFGRGLTEARARTAPSILGSIDRDAMLEHTGTVYRALDVLAEALRDIPARKNLVVFSPGIADHSEPVRAGVIIGRSSDFDTAIDSLNASNVSVYALQLQEHADAVPYFHQRLNELADETGGQYFQFTNRFEPALDRIEAANTGYYLITYRSRQPRNATGFQKVDVSVRDPRLRVTARPGYQLGSL